LNPTASPSTSADAVAWSDLASFLRQLIHDIRNDLNVLELEVTILEEGSGVGAAPRSDVTSLRETIRAAERRLRELSAKFQQLSPVLTLIRVTELAENVQLLAARIDHVGQTGQWTVEATDLLVHADMDLLSEAILEILKNAAAFRAGAQPLNIRFHSEGADLRIVIQETRSEAPKDLASWGTLFFHANRGSYGLGLHYADRIVAAHQGDVRRCFHQARQALETTISIPLVDERALH
jgi:K+-sensing histidine kinase KdpD